MGMQMPLISVIIPKHNVSWYVERCINSVLNSTWKELEVIIVDDKSSDDTLKKIKNIDDIRCRILPLDSRGCHMHVMSYYKRLQAVISLL